MTNEFISKIIERIFNNSEVFNKFRLIIHDNYLDEKRILLKNLDRDKKTLDFGCGSGQFSVIFNPEKYYGVDTSSKYINFCKDKRRGNFILIKEFPPYDFKDNYFDQIFISAVVHHLEDNMIKTISKELSRILNKNGKIFVVDHFTMDKQKNILCKSLIKLDRGNYFRNPNYLISLFSSKFKVKKLEVFRNTIYRDYLLVLSKK
mgnify:FL=1